MIIALFIAIVLTVLNGVYLASTHFLLSRERQKNLALEEELRKARLNLTFLSRS